MRAILMLVMMSICSIAQAQYENTPPWIPSPYTPEQFEWYEGETDVEYVTYCVQIGTSELADARETSAMAWSAWMVDPYNSFVLQALDEAIYHEGWVEVQLAITNWKLVELMEAEE